MSIPIYICPPKDMANRDIVEFFQNQEWPTRSTTDITLDFRKLKFIAPWAICLYGAYTSWMREKHQCKIHVKGNPTTMAGAYFAHSKLADLVGDQLVAPDTTAQTGINTIQLSGIRESADIPPFVAGVMNLLDIDDREMAGATQYSLVELIRNALQHSNSATGGVVMAQSNPGSGEVEVIVADMGEGIRKTLGSAYNGHIEDDTQALNTAIRPHVSGTFEPEVYGSMKDNAGLGLFITQEIAALSEGIFTLSSGDSILQIKGDEKGNKKTTLKQAEKKGWPGTFAMLQLRRGNIGDFDALLEFCRQAAEKARGNPLEFSLNFIENIPVGENIPVIRVRDFEENVEEAARIRDQVIAPSLSNNQSIVVDFSDIRFATQSFAHALFYKLFRDFEQSLSCLLLAQCSRTTQVAIKFVAGYATIGAPGKVARQDAVDLTA